MDRKHSVYTYTLQEIWNTFPDDIVIDSRMRYELFMGKSHVAYFSWSGGEIEYTLESFSGDNELNLLYKMLCFLVEKGYLKGG